MYIYVYIHTKSDWLMFNEITVEAGIEVLGLGLRGGGGYGLLTL